MPPKLMKEFVRWSLGKEEYTSGPLTTRANYNSYWFCHSVILVLHDSLEKQENVLQAYEISLFLRDDTH